ncbi:MAG: hypothetical protein POELPBGB_03602 [Bacteroidia bacterium]|nr:hypothetical protein [Bacteroidia bacterium]
MADIPYFRSIRQIFRLHQKYGISIALLFIVLLVLLYITLFKKELFFPNQDAPIIIWNVFSYNICKHHIYCSLCYLTIGVYLLLVSSIANYKNWIRNGIRGNEKTSEILQSLIKNINHKSYFLNVHSNLLLSKLRSTYEPITEGEQGFSFIRIKTDFLRLSINDKKDISQTTQNKMSYDFVKSKIEDFKVILDSIKMSWLTISYGDISDLLNGTEYISKNIDLNGYLKVRDNDNKLKIIRFLKSLPYHLAHFKLPLFEIRPFHFLRKDLKRVFIYPFLNMEENELHDGETKFTIFIEALQKVKLNNLEIENMILLSDDSPPKIDEKYLKSNIPNDDIRRAIKDLFYLYWLVSISQEYKLQYRILFRHSFSITFGMQNFEVGKNLLSNWVDEGTALLDNEAIVKFDERFSNTDRHLYHYSFELVREIENFNYLFKNYWNNSNPKYLYTSLDFEKEITKIFNEEFSNTFFNCQKVKRSKDIWIASFNNF